MSDVLALSNSSDAVSEVCLTLVALATSRPSSALKVVSWAPPQTAAHPYTQQNAFWDVGPGSVL